MFWSPTVHKNDNASYQHEIDISSKTEKDKTFEEYTDEEWNKVLKSESLLSPHNQNTDDTPPTLSCDQVNSTRPKVITYSSDVFQKALSFRNVDKVLAKVKQVAQPTVKINDLGRDPMRYPGDMATMPKQRRNTTPLQRPERFGDVVHFDILYGSGTSIGGYRYALWFVDIRFKHIEQYPLNYLSSDEILKALPLFDFRQEVLILTACCSTIYNALILLFYVFIATL